MYDYFTVVLSPEQSKSAFHAFIRKMWLPPEEMNWLPVGISRCTRPVHLTQTTHKYYCFVKEV